MNSQLVSQSFLDEGSDRLLAEAEVGVVGLCGGGSHIVQQLAHLGVGNFVVVDPDHVEERNLNRLVGATRTDARIQTAKTAVAERVIHAVNPDARVAVKPTRWQEVQETLRRCNVIFGCIDSYNGRAELERFARRYLIPYIDIGMDVHQLPGGRFSISGQAVLSLPGGPCLWCLGILTEKRVRAEAPGYGAAGSRPQVVWPNGVLASIAVGLFVEMVCPWHGSPELSVCREFDGNRHLVESKRQVPTQGVECPHFTNRELGDGLFHMRVD